nr:MAG TPA: hypothetical protein [Caudoviricetes sp.]
MNVTQSHGAGAFGNRPQPLPPITELTAHLLAQQALDGARLAGLGAKPLVQLRIDGGEGHHDLLHLVALVLRVRSLLGIRRHDVSFLRGATRPPPLALPRGRASGPPTRLPVEPEVNRQTQSPNLDADGHGCSFLMSICSGPFLLLATNVLLALYTNKTEIYNASNTHHQHNTR